MNARDIKAIDTLCARAEQLQARLAKRRDCNENRVHEYVAKAKDNLLDALREAEECQQ
jgi:guanylate kinase